MKTKNNVQKTILRTGAVVLSLVLLSFTVAAQGYWKQLLSNNSFTLIASALVDHRAPVADDVRKPGSSSASNADYNLLIVNENPLLIEQWMVNNDMFGMNSELSNEIAEAQMGIEPWMVDSDFFNTGNITCEQPLHLEGWMANGNFWK
jgi:hypothetical protein